MTTMARCYLREAVSSYGVERSKALCEGMKHYTGELLEVVNEAHPNDLPMVLAALDVVDGTIRELPEYKVMQHAETAESWCRQLKPVVGRLQVGLAIGEADDSDF